MYVPQFPLGTLEFLRQGTKIIMKPREPRLDTNSVRKGFKEKPSIVSLEEHGTY